MLHISQPLTMKGISLGNRLVMPPMASAKSDNGAVSQELCAYYDEKSQDGQFGLIITEHAYISSEGKASLGQLSIADESCIKGLSQLVSIIHNNGTKVIAQINHAGCQTSSEITGKATVRASTIRLSEKFDIPHELSKDDIKNIVKDFTNSAMYAKEAGFDGVEIHSAHGYLLNQFYSPLTNKRKDEYNGSTLEGRVRFHLEIIESIRKNVGDEFIIALRLGACDYMEGGSTKADSVKAAVMFETAGIDLLDISGGFCGFINPQIKEQGYFAELTKPIKDAVSIPVILTGGIVEGAVAEELLATGQADLIGVGRAILKDSLWAKKAINTK
ncbi:NADH:flavin oxidoreductase [Anaerocolumna sp. AGMB13020]|uniref:NADH:flavin oxidoreductase n=1 Tax=Anaerocolumna sp. AGMB13020 TaxID=3081750 RepID=UPI002955A436|nr:NADH:flavin oxidoreductase [Anaerocolumna sp. AGMB13020]WOO37070.1 NADH:flavin oxidoreductase [Anaerocolumna sp. AGMB13020]